jgi:hypothetical protein
MAQEQLLQTLQMRVVPRVPRFVRAVNIRLSQQGDDQSSPDTAAILETNLT